MSRPILTVLVCFVLLATAGSSSSAQGLRLNSDVRETELVVRMSSRHSGSAGQNEVHKHWESDMLDDSLSQGYASVGDTVTFYFSEELYSVLPQRVSVTGQFRDWSQDMEDPEWQLTRGPDGIWSLTIVNVNYEILFPDSPFKFRIDDGTWIDPPDVATNKRGGNLVFLPGVERSRLKAEIRGPRAIWATVTNIPSPDATAFLLEDANGNEIPISAALPNSASELLVVPDGELDVRRVYYLSLRDSPLRALVRRDPWFRTLYSTKELGATIADDGASTTFRLFAPRATRIVLRTYASVESPATNVSRFEMTPDQDGVWEMTIKKDYEGYLYDFEIYGSDDPGDHFFNVTGQRVSDPYARASLDSFGPSVVLRPTVPATPLASGRPAMKDLVSYEVHVQDFTDDLPVHQNRKGTFAAMSEPGLRNESGSAVGIDYLVDLGINAVHLMPVQEFLHYPDDEWQAAFRDDPYMQSQEIARENYQWGYRTTHAFAIESRYRVRDNGAASRPGSEREQFRDLVQAYHDRGIAVLIDLVPNHTGENMDGREYIFTFNGIDKAYYYRTNENLEHIGPFGNEVKSEDRPMVQRWIIDQCLHFIKEFGIDGFRIDLAGQIDEQTLKALRRAVGDDIIIYGEPWIAPSDPDVAANPDWSWYKIDAPITYFQDSARDAFKGSPSNPQDPSRDRGFAGGNGSQRGQVMLALRNGFEDEVEPGRGINYLDIHDNWTLADRFAISDWNGLLGVEEDRYRIAATLLFTSLGPLVLHGGSEIMRSKGSAPLEELTRETKSGPLAFHGKRDTYNLRVANRFLWETVGQRSDDNPQGIDFEGMRVFWKGLIDLRSSEFGRSLRIDSIPPDDYYKWILPDNELLLGYSINDELLVLVNSSANMGSFDIGDIIPAGSSWRAVVRGGEVNIDGVSESLLNDSDRHITVAPTSAMIWVRER